MSELTEQQRDDSNAGSTGGLGPSMGLGMCLVLPIGAAFGNIALSLAFGSALGVALWLVWRNVQRR